MNRRCFLLGPLAAGFAAARESIGLDRISLLTDEAAKSPQEAIDFARQYGVRWVELRSVPGARGASYWSMEEGPLREVRQTLDRAGLRVSFLNTSMLKYALPGAEPVRRGNATQEAWQARLERDARRFDRRMDELMLSIRAARILGVGMIRIFAFTRVAQPESLFPRIAEIVQPLAHRAGEEGMTLLIENEASCNVATTAETARFFDVQKHPHLGINWDPINALHAREEVQFPAAYALLPKNRLRNVQMKAEGLVIGKTLIDWRGVFDALATDGYQGKVGLETHVFDGTLIEKAHLSMKKIHELTGARMPQ